MLARSLEQLRHSHRALAEDVLERNRLLWIGSGISIDQAPDLVELIRQAFLFLRERAVSGAPDAVAHDQTLRRILGKRLPDELNAYDTDKVGWLPGDLESLRKVYSEVLATRVSGKPSNYLLLEASDVPGRYGDASVEPGPDHLLIALLVGEGVVVELASGNWDGLIESAVLRLSGPPSPLSVHVIGDDVRDAGGDARIAKFHGCAVLALADPVRYGGAIVATRAQISNWETAAEFAHMRDELRLNVGRYRSLVLGLSFQDADLLTTISYAAQSQPWHWDPDHPAYVFAEPTLLTTQEDVLQISYGTEFEAKTDEIIQRSVTGDYARSLLAALTCYVVTEKLKTAIDRQTVVPAALATEMKEGIALLEELVVGTVGNEYMRLVDFLVNGLSALVRQYYGSRNSNPEARYVPLVVGSRSQLVQSQSLPMIGADLFALAIATVGEGIRRQGWKVRMQTREGHVFLEITRPGSERVLLAIARGMEAADAVLRLPSWISERETMTILHGGEQKMNVARSPTSRLGTGRNEGARREIWIPDALGHITSVDEALQNLVAGGIA